MATAAALENQIRTIDPDEERAFLDAIDRWLEREVIPVIQHHDHGDIWPEKLVEQMAEMGLFGATIGQEYGGLGLPATTYAKIVMRISSYWMAITGIFNSHLIMAAAVERFGTPEQKAKWLPKFATGEIRGGLALTEPNAGTDLQAIRSVAVRDGDDYVINGTKTWISNALNGSCFAMLVKTDPKAEPRYKGMSLFIADKRDGLTNGKKFDKLGYKAIDSAELIMEDYRIPADQLIGGVEGQGFFQATGGLELGRINVAARGVGLAEGSLRLATEYAQQRETMGKPIAEHQAIQLKIGEMATRARAARLLTLDAAEAYDRGERCDKEAGMAKFFASEAAVENSQEAMRVYGGYSYSKEYDIERYYRDSMLMCIGEGTNEMQRIIIAKQHFKENPI
ncbi:acyl-CoA dehydrogenase family protein [Altererythrobacter arenosus]|uniref:Acyl-CoA dehydrogenase family protein n=1 Tax=Altererythrobacter arenosus TaxID=3032592 RepID=A0ABY8FTF4_9SPHN|nr:acyl-CoA dehydrogenase family protein [Altererythrobacter sp. CAU 1644]WFL76371.1 acyl-CoA dehydrogenase family protein [Altererythrobacter sp. CAU 1644]